MTVKICVFIMLSIISINNGQPVDLKSNQDFNENGLYLIRYSTQNRLPIDATNPSRLTLQKQTGDENQLWNIVKGDSPSMFYIVHNKTGHVLDYIDDGDHTLAIKKKTCTLDQQWVFMPNGHILNVGAGQYIDVREGQDVPGNLVRLYNGNANAQSQTFVLSYQACEYKDYEF